MTHSESPMHPEEEFSLVLGGPLYQLFMRAHMVSPPTGLVGRRIIAAILITWFPLVLLSALNGTFYHGADVPFIADLGNLRFLIILPILIAGEPIVHRRIRDVVAQFEERRLIPSADLGKFSAILAKAMKVRNSATAEVLLLILSYTLGHWIWSSYGSVRVSTWYADSGGGLSYAGFWFVLVSLPLIRFILLRWFFRLFIWYMFLWSTSRLPLHLNALHPDRAGGLGFLSNSITALTPILFAQSCFLSAQIGNEILHEGSKLPQYQILIVSFLAFLTLQALLPLFFFTFQLANEKLAGSHAYGIVASRYTSEFRAKWLAHSEQGELLGNSDIQSLADLANSFDVVRTMRLTPFDKRGVLRLILTLAIPLLPLALTMLSIGEIIDRLIRLLA